MVTVIVRNNDVSKAIKELKKKTFNENIVDDVRRKMYFEPKTVKRRRKKAEAIHRHKRDLERKAKQDGIIIKE